MEVILRFLHSKVQDEIRSLSGEALAQTQEALSLLIRKKLMGLVQKNQQTRIVEISDLSEDLKEDDCKSVLEVLKIRYEEVIGILKSKEILIDLVLKALQSLKDWGAPKTMKRLQDENSQLSKQSKGLQTQKSSKTKKSTNSAFVKEASSSLVPLADLTEMKCQELKLFTTHKGRFIKGTLVGKPVVTTGVTHLLKTGDGSCLVLGIYNMGSVESQDDFEAIFPTLSEVIIKEPYFKIFDNGDRGIRIDEPSDIQPASALDLSRLEISESTDSADVFISLIKDKLSKIRQAGNQKFVQKQFEEAAGIYKTQLMEMKSLILPLLIQILKQDDLTAQQETRVAALVLYFDENNSGAHSKYCEAVKITGWSYDEKTLADFTGRTFNASKDPDPIAPFMTSDQILNTVNDMGVILSNLSACLVALEIHEEAIALCELALAFPLQAGIVTKINYRLATCQIMAGHPERVNMSHMESALSKSLVANIGKLKEQSRGKYDWDDIMSKYVCDTTLPITLAEFTEDLVFKEIEGKGIGTRCRNALGVGDLIIVSNALAHEERRQNVEMMDFTSSDVALTGPQAFLARTLIRMCKTNVALRCKLRALYAGPKFARVPVKDAVCPYLPCISPTQVINKGKGVPPSLTPERVANIIKFNAFGANRDIMNDTSNSTVASLFYLPSMLNHDENPNVSWVVLGGGSLLVARAIRPIPAGTELTITYSCELRYAERKKALENYGFPFTCPTKDPAHIAEAAEKSRQVSLLKEQANRCADEAGKQQILKRARKLNNSIISQYSQYFHKMSPILMGFLYDKMDLNIALGQDDKAKHCLKVMMATFPGFVNEDLLHTAATAFPDMGLELRTMAEEVTRWMYGSTRLLAAFALRRSLEDTVSKEDLVKMAHTLYRNGQLNFN